MKWTFLPKQRNLVPKSSQLPSLFVTIALCYRRHFPDIASYFQIQSTLAGYEELAVRFKPIRKGKILCINNKSRYASHRCICIEICIVSLLVYRDIAEIMYRINALPFPGNASLPWVSGYFYCTDYEQRPPNKDSTREKVKSSEKYSRTSLFRMPLDLPFPFRLPRLFRSPATSTFFSFPLGLRNSGVRCKTSKTRLKLNRSQSWALWQQNSDFGILSFFLVPPDYFKNYFLVYFHFYFLYYFFFH